MSQLRDKVTSSEASSLHEHMKYLRQEFEDLKRSIGCSHSHPIAEKMPAILNALGSIANGDVKRVDMDNISVYKAGSITRIDIKEK